MPQKKRPRRMPNHVSAKPQRNKEDLKDLSLRKSSNEGVGNNIDQETRNIMVLSLRNITLNRSRDGAYRSRNETRRVNEAVKRENGPPWRWIGNAASGFVLVNPGMARASRVRPGPHTVSFGLSRDTVRRGDGSAARKPRSLARDAGRRGRGWRRPIGHGRYVSPRAIAAPKNVDGRIDGPWAASSASLPLRCSRPGPISATPAFWDSFSRSSRCKHADRGRSRLEF